VVVTPGECGGEHVALVPQVASEIAARLRADADEADEVSRQIRQALVAAGKDTNAPVMLQKLADWSRFAADDLSWRVDVIIGADNRFALRHGMVGAIFRHRSQAEAQASAEVEARQMANTTPERVAEWWNTLDMATRHFLIQARPELIGDLLGVPTSARSQANQRRAQKRLEELRAERACFETMFGGPLPLPGPLRQRRDALDRQIASHERMLARDVTLLHYDPTGDGRAIAVIGQIEDADHIGVFVPGTGNDVGTMKSQIDMAARMQRWSSRRASQGRSVATVLYLGYDTPDNIALAARGRYANDGDAALATFVSIEIPTLNRHGGGSHVTVVGHSYGSTIVGQAARRGMRADDVVLVGSPGVNAERAEALGDPRHVWVGAAPWDPVPHAPAHGSNPAEPEFGANRFRTGEARGHSEYYGEKDTLEENESSANIARVITGDYAAVTPAGVQAVPAPGSGAPV
jgi:Alpha/beta hydrolase